VSPSTLRNDAARIRNHIIPELGTIPLAALTAPADEAFMRNRGKAGLSPQSVHHLRSLLRRALNRALRHDLVMRNVVTLTDLPEKVTKYQAKFLSVDEARGFLTAIKGDALEAVWTLALTTGLRRGEVLALRWRDVDLSASTYQVAGTLQRVERQLRVLKPKTEKSKARGYLGRMTVAALEGHRQRQVDAGIHPLPDAYIFTTSTGRAIEPRNVNRSFTRLLARHNLKHIRLHDLRHTVGSLMQTNEEGLRVVMEVLRHSQISTTMNTYVHVENPLLRAATDRLDALLQGGDRVIDGTARS
jgi:integrase